MYYSFTITIQGSGDTPEEAWRDATEYFALDPGCTPDEYNEIEEEESEVI